MKAYVALGTAILFGIFLMPGLVHAASGDAEAALFEYLNDEWVEVGTTDVPLTVSADVNGEVGDELVTGARYGSAPVVRITNPAQETMLEFAAYDPGMLKGFDFAVGDLDGDNLPEIITAAGPGTNGHVRIMNWLGAPKLFASGIFPFGQTNRGGAFVGTADLDGNGVDELLIGSGSGAATRIQIWSGVYGFMGEFVPFEDSEYGVHVSGADLNGDGRDEIIAAQAYGGGKLRVFDGLTWTLLSNLAPFGDEFDGGVRAAARRASNPEVDGLVVSRAGDSIDSRPWLPQYIAVDISEQRLYAYEFGNLVHTFLVSTGLPTHPTPIGEWSALAKPEFVHYMWSYGENDPNNYDLGVVQWNVRFFPHIYIHYAPWHNNFGRRMSHGCVNVDKSNAEWIWNWTTVGMPITVRW
ncbi:MAG: L,D-transpeptidase family protein [Patescibacteria group bacterium]